MKRVLKVKLRKLANATHIHQDSLLFKKGKANFNRLWKQEMRVRKNPETDGC